MRESFGGPSPLKFLKQGSFGAGGSFAAFPGTAIWKDFLHRQEDRGSGVEVTWLVLAELDLNPSFLGLLALVFTSHWGRWRRCGGNSEGKMGQIISGHLWESDGQ